VKRSAALIALGLLLGGAQAPPEQSTYDRGVAARRAGDHLRALALLSEAATQEPGNADVHLQIGLAHLALGQLEEAEAAFRRTLALAPDYADARIGLARVAQRRGDRSAALAELEPLAPGHAEADALRLALRDEAAGSGFATRVDADIGYSDVEGQPDWQETALQVRHEVTDRTALTARVEAARRFERNDVYGEVRIDQRLSEDVGVWASAGGTPDADFRPKVQVAAGGAARVRRGPAATVLTLEARHADYRSGDIQAVIPGVEQYFAGGRAWATARWINIFDERGRHRSGWLARGDVMASERLRLFAGAADAPEVSEGIVTDTFSLFGGLALDVSRRSTIRASLAHDDRRGGGDRLTGAVGLSFRF
jgi:YaiO family outer membrane protein